MESPSKHDSSVTFRCGASAGAITIFLSSGQSQTLSPAEQDLFATAMLQHRDTWHVYMKARGHQVEPEDICLVYGITTASRWALSVFDDIPPGESIRFERGKSAPPSFVKSTLDGTVGYRCSPCGIMEESEVEDQCLFVKYIKMKTRPRTWDLCVANIKGTAERFLEATETKGPYPEAHPQDLEKPSDPLDHLLDYILSDSRVKVAIASHDDFYNICTRRFPPPRDDPEPYKRTLQKLARIEVDQKGVGRARPRRGIGSSTPEDESLVSSNDCGATVFPFVQIP